MKKNWEVKGKMNSKISNPKERREKIIEILLKERGLKTKKEIDYFLNPPDPYSLKSSILGIKDKEINKAIKRIKKAIKNKESIVIYGDYDADGVCASAILWETLHGLKAKVMPFIPDREKHGYGLKKEGIDEVIARFNPQLIITVDNGIVAKKGMAYAKKKNIEVIITDHHQPQNGFPPALAIIWSDQTSGAGVAWFLSKEIYQYFHKNLLGFKASNSLELACVGIITDQMPLLKSNRSLVKYGLGELRLSQRPGIVALCQEAGLSQKEIGVFEIGYMMGPRLNAMGRLEDALESLRLLCTRNSSRADGLASKLGLTNRQRQQLTETTFEHAKKSSQKKSKKTKILFVSHKSYNQGVIGLVAGKLVEEFYRSAVVIAEGKYYSKGSARGIKGFNIIANLRKLKHIFEDLGGHPMAAGFTIKTEKIKELEKSLELLAKKKIKKELLEPKLIADLEIDFNDINWKLFEAIEKFAPFGLGNPEPIFMTQKVKVISSRAVGRQSQHLKLKLESCSNSFNAIGFGQGTLAKKLFPSRLIDICFNVEKNVWNGDENLELKIKDLVF